MYDEDLMTNRAITILSTQHPDDKTVVRVFCDSLERELTRTGLYVDRMTYHDCSVLCKNICIWMLKIAHLAGRGMQYVMSRLTIYIIAFGMIKLWMNTSIF